MMKNSLTSAAVLGFATLLIFSCKKKDDTQPETTSATTTTTGGGTTTTGGTTTGGQIGATSNTLTISSWQIISTATTTTYNSNQAGFTDNATNQTRTYQFGANIGTSSPVSLNFIFAGNSAAPASGTYTMIDFAGGATPTASQVVVSNGGFGGGYSALALNSAVLVTNNSGTITIEATGAKLLGFTGGTLTLNAKCQN